MALLNLLRLSGMFPEAGYDLQAEKLISFISGNLQKYPTAFPRMLQARDDYWDRSKEVVVVSPEGSIENNLNRIFKNILHFSKKIVY